MSILRHIGTQLSHTAKRFGLDEKGNIAMLFGLSLIPMMAATGAAVDYSRASQARSQILAAADSAALAVARRAPTLTDAQLLVEAQRHYSAVLNGRADLKSRPIKVTRGDKRVQVVASGTLPTTFMRVIGYNELEIGGRVEAGFGDRKAELVLALDNTGSMDDRDPVSGARKIDELKKATRNLIAAAEAAAPVGSGMIKVGIVPFETQVRLDTASMPSRNPSWLAYQSTDPAFANIRAIMKTSGSWDGCLSDRGPGFATNDRRADVTRPDSLYPAVECATTAQQRLLPLTDNWGKLRTLTDGMTPGGCTNVTIGARFGMAALNPDDILGGNAAPLGDPKTDKYLVILTDGKNTQDRASSDCKDANGPAGMDAKTLEMCNSIKAKPRRPDGSPAVTVFTIRLIAGNIDMLRSCASDPSKYKEVNDASQLDAVFKDIISQITALRLTM
jgi:type II secretory pathway pseudopilin PulG